MGDELFASIIIRICFGLFMSFTAILFWSKNRDLAWTFMITGSLMLYLSTVFSILFSLKVLVPEYFTILGIGFYDVFSIFITNVPFLLFSLAFIMMLRKK
ncbi:MAG: hypothetical protein EHM28_10275 [Spirochaetaceae bacterium]|nr:MAG: hypothetical protein EHM28_10275 [Spirochaetaceae bacterium]